ncbi:MAG: DoxX family protein [Planctomycetota bacterium]|nr:DoxX family protein [Planctomycetota bacterium]
MPETGPDNTLTGCRRILLEWSDVPLRAILAATFITHGYDKIFVKGVSAFAAHMPPAVPLPSVMAWVAALAEFGGAIAIALGLLTRVAALGHICVMAVALLTIHLKQGFMTQHDGAGSEWQLALFCMALCLLLRGAGPLSLDRVISGYWRRKAPTPGTTAAAQST